MAGLVLTRRVGEKIHLKFDPETVDGLLSMPEVWVELDSINSGGQVRLRITAPEEVRIMRGEHVLDRPFEEGPPAFESMRNSRPVHGGYPGGEL